MKVRLASRGAGLWQSGALCGSSDRRRSAVVVYYISDGLDEDGVFVSLYSSFMHTMGMAQAAELQQWQHQ